MVGSLDFCFAIEYKILDETKLSSPKPIDTSLRSKCNDSTLNMLWWIEDFCPTTLLCYSTYCAVQV